MSSEWDAGSTGAGRATGTSRFCLCCSYLPSFWPSPVKALKAPLGFTKSSSRWSSMSKFTCPPWANLRSSAGTSLQEKRQCCSPQGAAWEWQWWVQREEKHPSSKWKSFQSESPWVPTGNGYFSAYCLPPMCLSLAQSYNWDLYLIWSLGSVPGPEGKNRHSRF